MAVTPAQIKELREISGAGMTDCKKALDQTDGDIQKAVVILREKGLASAAKKAGRIAAEGLVLALIADDGKSAAVVEVNCETDFVAKTPEYRVFVENLATTVLKSNAKDVDAFIKESWNFSDDATVDDAIKTKIALYGENIGLRRFEKLTLDGAGFFQKYIHMEGKVAVVIQVASDVTNDAMLEAAKNACMQICVMRPLYVSNAEVDPGFLEQEKEIITTQTKEQIEKDGKPKPEQVVQKMIDGKIAKRLKEICLLDQEYVKDESLTIGKYLEGVFKENEASASVAKFAVFEKGEGIEKKVEDFAEEVNKAMNV